MLKINDLERHHAPLQSMLANVAREVLESGWYVLGRRGQAFEGAFADFCGTTHAVGVASGTDALELALRAVGIGPGDDVVTVPNAGMYASVAIQSVGANPILADVKADDMVLDPLHLERVLGPRCKAIVLTHLYGRLADVDRVLEIANGRGVPVIEDCAQAHGAALGQRRAGSFGRLGCFSFYPTKNLGACGDGGAITTSDPALAERVCQLRQYGWSEKYKAVVSGGRNSRLDELQAAILIEKLPRLPAWNARRVEIAQRYSAEIHHPLVKVPTIEVHRHVAHLYVVQCTQRDGLRDHLRRNGIGAEVHYPVPDHLQPVLIERYRGVRLPVAERLAREVLTLPCFPEMTDGEIEQVIASCNAWRP
jgi:dTDP-4-amino-4,6-dideoxygalactose transaminase